MCKYLESRTELTILHRSLTLFQILTEKTRNAFHHPATITIKPLCVPAKDWSDYFGFTHCPSNHTNVRCTSLDMWFAIKSQCHSRSVVVVVVVIVGPSFYPPERSTRCARGRAATIELQKVLMDGRRRRRRIDARWSLAAWLRFQWDFWFDDLNSIRPGRHVQNTVHTTNAPAFRMNERVLAPFGLANWFGHASKIT